MTREMRCSMSLAMNMKKSGLSGILLCAMLFLFGAVSHATPLDDALKSNDETSFSGIIMEVHNDYLVVSERKILLVNEKRNGRAYTTLIMDLNGKPQSFQSLAVGNRIFVKGFLAREGNSERRKFIAREIYLLPKKYNRRNIEENTMLNSPSSPW